MAVSSLFTWLQRYSFTRWRDALVLTTAWLFGVGVCFVFVVQPLWQQHNVASAQYQQALYQYQSLQQLTAFLPPETKPIQGPHPSLNPSNLSNPSISLSKNRHLRQLSKACTAQNTMEPMAVYECQWVWLGSQQAIGNAINILAQQPSLILYQARVIPSHGQWKLTVSGVTVSKP